MVKAVLDLPMHLYDLPWHVCTSDDLPIFYRSAGLFTGPPPEPPDASRCAPSECCEEEARSSRSENWSQSESDEELLVDVPNEDMTRSCTARTRACIGRGWLCRDLR